MDRTFAMVKPDGVQRGLAGEIISRFKNKGIKLTNLFMLLEKFQVSSLLELS
jgi:nucleoside-diphosphate kinase